MDFVEPVHRMQLPREVLIGHGVLNNIDDLCRGLGFKSSILILTGPHVYELITHNLIQSLKSVGYDLLCYIVKESRFRYVKETMKLIDETKPEVLLGIGGGKVIDVAKLAASNSHLPFISIPTAASHDGISSPRANIKDLGKSTSVDTQAPLAIVADLDVISESPYRLTASGCGDIISKYTAVRDWELAHKLKKEYYGEYAANLALMSAKLVLRNAKAIRKKKESGIRIVLEALISCGVAMSIAGSSRPCSGSEHLFSHALDIVSPNSALHGEQCGVGSILMAYLQRKGWRMIEKNLRIIGAPTTAEELGIEPKYIIEAITLASTLRPDRYTILGDGLTKDVAENLAKAAGIID
jgi:glycerol-1-phosphate dehydrogenase [NAD(P)+]